MTMTEVREIKEQISLDTVNLKGKELQDYYSSRAKKMQNKINNSRRTESIPKNIPVTTSVH